MYSGSGFPGSPQRRQWAREQLALIQSLRAIPLETWQLLQTMTQNDLLQVLQKQGLEYSQSSKDENLVLAAKALHR